MKNNKGLIALFTAVIASAVSIIAINKEIKQIVKKLLYKEMFSDEKNNLDFGESVSIKAIDNRNLFGTLLNRASDTTIIALHSHGRSSSYFNNYINFFDHLLPDSNILLVDARAHGKSEGMFSGLGHVDVEDLKRWNEYVLNHLESEHIVLYGKEMGANTILNASGSKRLKKIDAIISDGAYRSVYELLKYRILFNDKMPTYPTVALIRKKVFKKTSIDIKRSTVLKVKHNDIPTIFVHLVKDKNVPISDVYRLYNANRGRKQLLILKDENELSELVFNDDYKLILKKFIKKQLKK